jgi:hypothetical protein
MAARTLFVEMCIKLQERGETTNAAIAHRLMYASLKDIHAQLRNTVADPLTSEQASRMAESIRAVFNTNAQVLRYLPDAGRKIRRAFPSAAGSRRRPIPARFSSSPRPTPISM